MWLAAYWQHFKPLTGEQKLEFVRLAGGFETAVAKDILLDALSDDGDWRIIQAAALPLGRMKHKQAVSPLEELSGHPVMAVQIAALTALDGIKTGTIAGRPAHWRNALSSSAAYCSAPAKDFKDDVKGLPFFDLSDIDIKAAGDKRRFLSTIAALKSGFIVGFDAGTSGGDLRYYDNASGDSLPLKELLSPQTQNITAIMPVIPVPLGQYANAFWIIAQSGPSTDQAKDGMVRAVLFIDPALASGLEPVRKSAEDTLAAMR